MSDERRYRGLWWIPSPGPSDEAVNEVGGILTISTAGRLHLETMSALVDGALSGAPRLRPLRSLDEPLLIHGAADGKAITLIGCTPTNGGQVNLGAVSTEVQAFRGDAAVIGCWLDDATELAFVGMRVEISHLTKWSGLTGMSWDLVAPEPDDRESPLVAPNPTVHTVELRSVPTADVDLPDERMTARLLSAQRFGAAGKENAWGSSHRVNERTLYEVRTVEPRHALDFQTTIRPMQNLLTLATQSPCAVGGRVLVPAGDSSPGEAKVELFFHGEDIDIKTSLEMHQLLFTLDDLGGVAAIEKWYALSREIGRPLNVLFGLDYETGGYYETRLFTVATVVEGFHAALFPTSTALDPDDHKLIRTLAKSAFKDLGKDLRAWASTKLRHNDSGYTKRCKELASLVDPTAVENLLGDTAVWAKWLAHARNVGAHGNLEELRHKSASEDAYYLLAATTQHLLHLVLMSKLGVDGSLQQRTVTEKWGYQARRFRDLVAQENT